MNEPVNTAQGDPTNAELVANITAAVGALQDGQAQAVEAVSTLAKHENSDTAHGIDNDASPLRKAIATAAASAATTAASAEVNTQLSNPASALSLAISNKATAASGANLDTQIGNDASALNTNIAAKAGTAATSAINTQLSTPGSSLNSAIASKASSAVDSNITAQLADPKSKLNTAISTSADTAIKDAIEDGSISGGGGGGGTITIPTITGPANAPIGFAISYTVSAASGLQNGSIASFRYKLGTAAEQTATATSSAATISVTVPSGTAVGTKLTLTVIAVDNYGNERSATKELTAIAASVNAPAITSPAAGGIVSAISIPMTGAGFSVIGSTDTQKRRRGRVCTPDGTVLFTGPWVTGNVTSLTLAPSPALTPKASVTLQMQDEGNSLGESSWSTPVTVTIASVVQPNITSPTTNAEVSDKNITVVTAAMALTGSIADTLVGADYTLYDTSGGVVASAKGIASTTHVFATPAVTKGSFYDIGVVQHSQNHGASIESVKRRIKIKTTRHGEILYDTSGNPAAVIVGSYASNGMEPWTIRGKQVWLAVALAAKRSVSIPWNTSSSDSNWQDISAIENPGVSWQLASSNTAADSNSSYVSSQSTEAHMDGSFTYSQAVKDSKALTDAIRAHNTNYQAAKICRDLALKDFGAMDLPRIEALMRIYQMRDKIDALDPTANANTAKKLAAWGFGSTNGAYVWSSSEYHSSAAWSVYSDGSLHANHKYSQFGVVPALEIPA